MTLIQHPSDVSAAATREELMALITQGFALHIDPDYLLKTYGDVTAGVPLDPNAKKIGPRYAICLSRGTDPSGQDVTVWTLCTTQEKATKQEIPILARRGAWADNPIRSFFSTDQFWVMPIDVAIEAHLHRNQPRRDARWSWLHVPQIQDWPTVPATWVERVMQSCFSARGTSMPHGAPQSQEPKTWTMAEAGAWLQEMRTKARLSREAVAKAGGLDRLTAKVVYRAETGTRCPDADELGAMARALGVTDAPELQRVPLATEGELKLRQAVRKAAVHPKEPQAPKPPIPLTPALPVLTTAVPTGPVSRPSILTKAASILGSHRISDQEAQDLLNRLIAGYKAIILSDLELPLEA